MGRVSRLVKRKLSLQIWIAMTIIVGLTIGFLIVVQVLMIEPYYYKIVEKETGEHMAFLEEKLAKSSATDSDFKNLSIQINGGVVLVNNLGNVIINSNVDENISLFPVSYGVKFSGSVSAIYNTRPFYADYYLRVINGKAVIVAVNDAYNSNKMLIMGHHVLVGGKDTALFTYQNIPNISDISKVLRNQIVMLAFILFFTISFIAAFISRYFVKPITKVEKTIYRITEGDYNAKSNLNRSDEIGYLSKSVDILGGKLQRVDFLRKEIIGNISHELKSPLVLIQGYAEMVKDISWKDDKERNENLQLIIDESKRMNYMVNEILDYSQLQSGFANFNKDNISLFNIIENEINIAKIQCEKYNISIGTNMHENIIIYADPLKISQVFRNLLNNATNHTLENGRIFIDVKKGQENDLFIAVKNTGIEISDEERELIFERYHRIQHHSGRKLGTGIGLSIVKSIYEAHNMEYGVLYDGESNIFWFKTKFVRIE